MSAERSAALFRAPLPAAARLPVFTKPFGEETTADSSPYLLTRNDFLGSFVFNEARRRLVSELTDCVRSASAAGVEIHYLLIGGSFVRANVAEPSDIDCLAIYSIPAQENAEALEWVAHSSRASDCHIHLCPSDSDLLVLIKRLLFFNNLFSYQKGSAELKYGTVLVSAEEFL